MNKYGGVNDLPGCDKRVYGLWFQMLRRCYDPKQLTRDRGKSYADCIVCDRWKYLSNFAKDIKTIDGYSEWKANIGYCLDKDTKIPGSRIYSRATCRFIPYTENIRDISKRHPGITKSANEANKTVYVLQKENELLVFPSEKAACEYLGVVKCSVSSCYHKGHKCKGYKIQRAKMDKEEE